MGGSRGGYGAEGRLEYKAPMEDGPNQGEAGREKGVFVEDRGNYGGLVVLRSFVEEAIK